MKKILERIKEDRGAYLGLLIGLAGYYAITHLFFRGFCPFVNFMGFPCPGCGMSRAVYYLLRGEFKRSFAMHPMAPVWIGFALWFLWERYIIGRNSAKRTETILTVIALLTCGVYLYRVLVLFPGDPPMAYTGNNLLERIIPGYHDWAVHLGK